MNEYPSPEFEKEVRETLGAPGADPAFVHHLRAKLLERSNMKKQTRKFYRLAWGFAAAVVLMGLVAASPGAVQALKRILGYIPGLGLVQQDNSLRILAAPVSLEKDGLRATVVKGATDSERTVLLGYFEGYTPDGSNCVAPARLILPDGTTLTETGHESESAAGGSYYERYVLEAMPAGQFEATLEIPCLASDSAMALPLKFEAAKEDEVMPLIELPTAAAVASAPSTLEGFSIAIAEAKPLPDGYVLSGSYEWTDPRFETREASIHVADVEIVDANGREVTFRPADPGFRDPSVRKLPFAYQITGTDYAYPLTIQVNSIVVDLLTGSTFQFDAGPNPQVGQVWDVNLDVPVDEHVIHIQTIELTGGDTPTQLGFTFRMSSDPGVMAARIQDTDPAIAEGGGGGGGGGGSTGRNPGSFESGWLIEGYSPAGVKTFVVSNVTVMLNGTWQATWQPSGQ